MFREVVLLITAAGLSSRMGMAKGTVTLDNRELLEVHIENFRKAFPDAPIYLVIGHHIQEYQHYCKSVRFIENVNYSQGQFSSILAGLKGIPNVEHSQLLLQPVDLAPISSEIYTRLVAAPPQKEVVKPRFKSKSGHPILLRGSIIPKILNSSPEGRLDNILKSIPILAIEWIEVKNPNINTNLNSPEELEKFIKGQK